LQFLDLNLNSIIRSRICGYDLDLKYPETKKYPTITAPMGGLWKSWGLPGAKFSHMSKFQSRLRTNLAKAPAYHDKRKRGLAHREWKRDLSARPNGTIDPWYGCDLTAFVLEYALNFTYPWSNGSSLGFNVRDDWRFLPATDSDRIGSHPQVYDIPSALDPPADGDASFFVNGTSTIPPLEPW
jgi:carboxypeptidase D